jgi:hypothetical protein
MRHIDVRFSTDEAAAVIADQELSDQLTGCGDLFGKVQWVLPLVQQCVH